jgi:hypothetical protein
MIKRISSLFAPAIKNLTGAAADYLLLPGDTARITFTDQTSVPLRVAMAEGGEYEIIFSATAIPATVADAVVYLQPNNTTYTGAFISQMIQAYGTSSLVGAGTSDPAFIFGYAKTIKSIMKLSNYVTCKSYSGSALFRLNNNTAYYNRDIKVFWNDASTVWASLGTLVFTAAQSGTVIIRRIA